MIWIRSTNPKHGGVASNYYFRAPTARDFIVNTTPPPPPPPPLTGPYVTEDLSSFYVTEDLSSIYFTEIT